MRIFLSGGCKNGKSTLAQRLCACQGTRRAYVATMRPRDAEDEARIRRHQAEREGWGFETVECATDIAALCGWLSGSASVLLDSVTALLAEEMFQRGGVDAGAPARVRDGLLRVADAFSDIVFVSDFLFSDARRYDTLTEAYRCGLALCDRALAARCDAVLEVSFGQWIAYKGGDGVAALLAKGGESAGNGAGAVHGPARVCGLG